MVIIPSQHNGAVLKKRSWNRLEADLFFHFVISLHQLMRKLSWGLSLKYYICEENKNFPPVSRRSDTWFTIF